MRRGKVQCLRVGDGLDDDRLVGGVPVRALDLLVVRVPDQQQRPPVAGEPAGLLVHLGHQGTGRVEHVQPARVRVLPHLRGDTVRGEDTHRALRHLLLGVDEPDTPALELAHHVVVVHDLLADIDRRAVLFQREVDDGYRSAYTGTQTLWLGQQDLLTATHSHSVPCHDAADCRLNSMTRIRHWCRPAAIIPQGSPIRALNRLLWGFS